MKHTLIEAVSKVSTKSLPLPLPKQNHPDRYIFFVNLQ